MSYGPCEAGSDIHRVGVEITLETPVPVCFAVEGPFCRPKRTAMIMAVEIGGRNRDVQVVLVPEKFSMNVTSDLHVEYDLACLPYVVLLISGNDYSVLVGSPLLQWPSLPDP